jgi:hypothetical protein
MTKPKPMLNGRQLSQFELAQLRRRVESSDTIDIISDEMRALIAGQWPELLAKNRMAKPH